jgi:squalene synthase HpnC
MNEAAAFASGKGHRDENFPVASLLIAPRLRPPIMAFYRFARAADDIADNASASADDKLRALEQMRAGLAGEAAGEPTAVALREELLARGLNVQHGLDLLVAFRRDVTQHRYADWDDLMDYCRWSAAPVGRMVLDIHGEPRTTWPASDALCAALQVINHLQDCAKDRRELDRVYLPASELAAAGADMADLDRAAASPALRMTIATLARRTQGLLEEARPLAGQVADFRLRAEIALIQALAEDLTARLLRRDPLSERVHHRKHELLGPAFTAVLRLVRPEKPLAPVPPARAEMTP